MKFKEYDTVKIMKDCEEGVKKVNSVRYLWCLRNHKRHMKLKY